MHACLGMNLVQSSVILRVNMTLAVHEMFCLQFAYIYVLNHSCTRSFVHACVRACMNSAIGADVMFLASV